MREFRFLVFKFLIIISILQCKVQGPASRARVTDCYDGDTCLLNFDQELWLRVRLFGIDAPEIKHKKYPLRSQPLAIEARDFLKSLVVGKEVNVHQVDLDRYNRPIVELKLASTSVNLTMVEHGFAEVYKYGNGRKSSKASNIYPYLKAEKLAKAEKSGIWSLDTYESPGEFRKE